MLVWLLVWRRQIRFPWQCWQVEVVAVATCRERVVLAMSRVGECLPPKRGVKRSEYKK